MKAGKLALNEPGGALPIVLRGATFLIVLTAGPILCGCVSKYDFEYISLARSMTVLETGWPTLPGVQAAHSMPIEYLLERDEYTLYAKLDQFSIPPAVVFWADSNSWIKPTVSGVSIPCYLFMHPVQPYESDNGKYPVGGVRVLWKPALIDSCQSVAKPEGESAVLELKIEYGEKHITAVERLQFEIVTNGTYVEFDAL